MHAIIETHTHAHTHTHTRPACMHKHALMHNKSENATNPLVISEKQLHTFTHNYIKADKWSIYLLLQ